MGRVSQAAIGLTAMLALAGSAWAAVTVQGGVQIVFTPEERKIIKECYSSEIIEKAREQEGQGKAKGKGKKGLPPGLAKREKLPPGLEKKMEPLRRELEGRLKRLPPDHVRVTIGTDVIILDKATQKILDIIRDVAGLTRDITK